VQDEAVTFKPATFGSIRQYDIYGTVNGATTLVACIVLQGAQPTGCSNPGVTVVQGADPEASGYSYTDTAYTDGETYSITTIDIGPAGEPRESTAAKQNQTITFAALANQTYGAPDFSLNATATSGLPVSFSAGGNCTVSGATAHVTGAGSCTIAASQSGDNNYGAAPPVSQTFQIGQASSSVTVTCNPASVPYNGVAETPCLATVTGAGGLSQTVPVTYTNNTNAGTATAGASYAGDANHTGSSGNLVAFTILPAPVTATAGSYSGTYDGNTHSTSACKVTGAYTGDLTCADSPSSVGTAVGSGTVAPVVSSPSGMALTNFSITSTNGSWSIGKAAATVTLGNLTQTYTGAQLSPTVTTLPASLSVTVTGAPQTNAGSYNVTATVNAANYAGSSRGMFTIQPAPVTVTWNPPTSVASGTALSSLETATANAAGKFVYSCPGTTGGVLNPGSQAVTVSFTPSVTTNYLTPPPITKTISVQSGGPALVTQVSVTASGLAYSRVSQTYNGTVTVKNTGASSVSGPIQIVLTSLTSGVTLANATGNFGGNPYITASGATLPPGQSVTVAVQLKNPANAKVGFSPVIYSGNLN
jgi:hypothetical protein